MRIKPKGPPPRSGGTDVTLPSGTHVSDTGCLLPQTRDSSQGPGVASSVSTPPPVLRPHHTGVGSISPPVNVP